MVVYVSGMRSPGIVRATSKAYYDTARVWHDKLYPHRIKIEPVLMIEGFRDLSEFWSTNFPTKNSGGYFRRGFRAIPEPEFLLFRTFIESGDPLQKPKPKNPLLEPSLHEREVILTHQIPPTYLQLDDLLRSIDQKSIVLPQFQRDFVWAPSKTVELLLSLSQGYPAGNLLFLRHGLNKLGTRPFEGVTTDRSMEPDHIVLDGQQRLTGLYHALYGRGQYQFYISLRDLKETGSLRESLNYEKADRMESYIDRRSQFERMVLPLSVTQGGLGLSFFEWVDDFTEYLEPEDETKRRQTKEWLTNVVGKGILDPLTRYKFPVVELRADTRLEDVCQIFEVLNTTALQLTVFELMTAKLWPSNIHLRTELDQAVEEYPLLSEFELDGERRRDNLLQSVALLARGACKRRDVLDLESEEFKRYWNAVVRGMNDALGLLKGCGVLQHEWLPYTALLASMASTFAHYRANGTMLSGAQLENMERWFWCSVFAQAYEGSTDTQNAKDFEQLLGWLEGGEEPDTVANFQFDQDALFKTTATSSALYKGVLCLLLNSEARDFHTGQKISIELLKNEKIEDHHIFPKGYLKTRNFSTSADTILNKTLIDASTNRKIRSKAPSEYVAEVQGSHSKERFAEVLESHLLPTEPDSPLWTDRYDEFIATRAERIYSQILRLTRTPHEERERTHATIVEEIILRPGQRNLAEEKFRQWVEKYFRTGDIVGYLMFIDNTTFAYLDYIPRSCSVTLLVGGIDEESKCLEAAKRAAVGRPSFEISRMKLADKPFSHERWLSDGNYELDPGTDIKTAALGKNEHTMRILKVTSESSRVEEFWSKYRNPAQYGPLAKRETFFTSK